jgi:hypothetical protein
MPSLQVDKDEAGYMDLIADNAPMVKEQHAPSPRYEIKINCEPHYLYQVHAWTRLHPAHWRVAYPPRQVNNIYFDTYEYKGLSDNLSGVGARRKLRLRWYGPVLETATEARLELKCKEGQVGWKEICPLDFSPQGDPSRLDLTHQSWSDLRQAIHNAADTRAQLWMTQFADPVLVNCYQRAYYVSPDQALRLTIDSKLRAYDQRFSVRPNLRRPMPIVDRVIIELKAERQYYRRLVNVLAQFPFRTDRYSKYVQGMLGAPDLDGGGLL